MVKFAGITTGSDLTIQLKNGETVISSRAFTDYGNTGDVTPPTTVTTPLSGTYTADVYAARVATLELPDDGITSVSVTSQPSHGRVTVNPDYTLACVLSESLSTADVIFDVSITDGSGTHAETVTLAVATNPQEQGWSLGANIYMLAVDGSDKVVVEPGFTHRKVHISKAGFTAADIVAREAGLSDTSQVTGAWLRDNTASGHSEKYGETEALALDEFAIGTLWDVLSANETSSNWLLFERGYTYDECPQFDPENPSTENRYWLLPDGINGESPRHPIVIGAYGTGADPIMQDYTFTAVDDFDNIVNRDLVWLRTSLKTSGHNNVIYDNVHVDGDFDMPDNGFEFQFGNGVTLRNMTIQNVTYAEPQDTTDPRVWDFSDDRIQGGFTRSANGVLMEGFMIDHCGWEDGFDFDQAYPPGQPTTDRNQGFYCQNDNVDVTIRDSVFSRNSYSGIGLRPGGHIMGNLIIDNHAQMNVSGGIYGTDGPIGTHSFVLDNVGTSGGYRPSVQKPNVVASGFGNKGYLNTWHRNMLVHLSDPNNATEIAAKADNRLSATRPYNKEDDGVTYDEFFQDLKIHRWVGSDGSDPYERDQNVVGLNYTTAAATTIQKFAESKIDDGVATLADFAVYLRGLPSIRSVVREAVDFFQNGFDIEAIPTAATTLNFVPSSLGEGTRLDNRLNWSPAQLPKNDDTLNLRGNNVYHDGTLAGIDMDMGAGGTFFVQHGYIQMDSLAVGTGGATLDVSFVGQVYLDGYSDADLLTVNVSGYGRFCNTGAVTGDMDVNVSGQAQVALCYEGSSFDLDGDLVVTGGACKVGYSGTTGTATLTGSGSISLVAASGALPKIEKFALNGDMTLGGTFNATATGITLNVNATGMSAGDYTIFDCDTLTGTFTSGTLTNCTINKVGNTYVATVAA